MKKKRKPDLFLFFVLLAILLYSLTGCGQKEESPATQEVALFKPPEAGPTLTPTIQLYPTLTPTPREDCINRLRFEKDISIPDGTRVEPGQSIVKRWLVTNAGTCNWNENYTVKLVSGPDLGAPRSQNLYPARNGQQVILQMTFTAPDEAGQYISTWQALDPQGNRFGDPFFIDILVQED
ncbi:MAG: NBR1-Ig-like domain-containing protein [Chloroflexota bacterium]